LTEVTNARANATAIKATPELINDPVAFQKFIKAQSELQGALSRLLAVAEAYPQLKSDALFATHRAARRHRKPDRGRAQPLHQDGAGIQHDGAPVPDQPDGDDLQDGRQAQLHRRERGGRQRAAEGGLHPAGHIASAPSVPAPATPVPGARRRARQEVIDVH
jgi:hypothetical protein